MCEGAAAGLGVRRPAQGSGVHTAGRLVLGRRRTPSCRARRCRSTSASSSARPLLGEARRRHTGGKTVFENDAVRLWHDGRRRSLVLSLKTKMHAIGDGRARRLLKARRARRAATSRGLVIWQPERAVLGRRRPAGAHAAGVHVRAASRRSSAEEQQDFQDTLHAHQVRAGAGGRRGPRPGARRRLRVRAALRHARWPRSRATSAWSKPASACCRRGGGLKEVRAARVAGAAGQGSDVFAVHARLVHERRRWPRCRSRRWKRSSWATCAPTDTIVFNAYELLHVAKARRCAHGRRRLPPAAARRAASRSPARTASPRSR